MKRSVVMSLTLLLAMVQGCGEKEPPPPQPQTPAVSGAAVPPPMAEGAPVEAAPLATSPAVAPATVMSPTQTPAGDARAVKQPSATPAPLPLSAVTPATATVVPSAKEATASGSLLKESELKERPFTDAATVAKLPAQARVTILERSSGWYRVESQDKRGWVRMLNVKVSEGATALGASSELQQAAALATGRAGTGNVVSTSGLRGLDEAQLTNAKPDYAQFDKLDSYGVSKEAASGYAQQNGLQSRSVSYLPAPK